MIMPSSSSPLTFGASSPSALSRSGGGNVIGIDNEFLGLKIEISSSIQLTQKDSYYGRKQVIAVPPTCHNIYDVKQYIKSIIQLPSNIHLKFGDFCLRDDQDKTVLSCFNEPVIVDKSSFQFQPQQRKSVTFQITNNFDNDLAVVPYQCAQHTSQPLSSDPETDSAIIVKKRGNKRNIAQTDSGSETDVMDGNSTTTIRSSLAMSSSVSNQQTSPSHPQRSEGSQDSERLTKSAKRRLRKLRLHGLLEQNMTGNGTSPEKPAKRIKTQDSQELIFASIKKQNEGSSSKAAQSQAIKISETPSSSTAAPNFSNTFSNTNSSAEFVKPKARKQKAVTISYETPCQNGSRSESSSSNASSSSGKLPRAGTPYLPKVIKNPMVFGFPGKLSLPVNSVEDYGITGTRMKPDTPNLPLVSKSPHYNYVENVVDKQALSQLSKTLSAQLAQISDESSVGSIGSSGNNTTANGTTEELQTTVISSNKKQVQDSNNVFTNGGKEESSRKRKVGTIADCLEAEATPSAKEEKGANGLVDRDAYFEGLDDITSVDQVQEGDIIAFKTTQLDEDSCPVVSPFKEALVKLKQGLFVQLEYLNTDSIEPQPAVFEVEGYTTYSTNNPKSVNFDWMISPKRVPRSTE